MPTTQVWTIGHSTRSGSEFVGLLVTHGIKCLVDVRRHAGSRKFPQFNPAALEEELRAAGLAYLPIPALGGRRPTRPDSINTAWRNASFRGYADHMASREFEQGLEQLMAAARLAPTAFMCAEALWWRCHRALIADALKLRSFEVLHIDSPRAPRLHPYTSAACVRDGRLTYSAPAAPAPPDSDAD